MTQSPFDKPDSSANDDLALASSAVPVTDWPIDQQLNREAEQWLVRLQSPTLSQKEEKAFFQWLELSPAHQAAYVKAEQFWSALGQQLPFQQARLNASRLSSASIKPEPQPGKSTQVKLTLATLAASVALVFGAIALFDNSQSFSTHTGERLQLSLADGSHIQLNTETQLEVELEPEQRLLELAQGEAYFDVESDPNRPFIVKTPGGYVRVLGTRFNIYTDAAKTVVSVVEGKVDVSIGRSLDHLAQLDFNGDNHLLAQQQVSLKHQPSSRWFNSSPVAKRGDIRTIDSEEVLAWQRGEAIYKGSTLNQVIGDLNRYYPGKIRLQTPELGLQPVVAVLRLDNKEAALNAIANSFQLSIVKLADGQVILKPSQD